MGTSFIITLREGLEAALIVGILLAYLNKVDKRQYKWQVISGVAFAVVASIITAYAFNVLIGGFEGRNEELFEGILMLAAVALITPMIFWMQRHGQNISSQLKNKADITLNKNHILGLFILAFLSVYREGVETVLFMQAAALNSDSGSMFWGGLAGIATAIILAVLVFKGTAQMKLGAFFKLTGIVLILFAAGLFSYGIHELQEAGVIPIFIEHIWNINHIIDEKGILGSFLKALLGYNGNPSLLEFISYVVYISLTLKNYLVSQQDK